MLAAMARLLIAGCGYVGAALAAELAAAGHRVWGLRRRTAPIARNVETLVADLADPRSLAGLPDSLDGVVYTASADAYEPEAYRKAYVEGPMNLAAALVARGGRPPRIVLVSSTGVYGRDDGAWVDETTPPEPRGFSGEILLEGERRLLAGSLPVVVVRFAGIYGPSRALFVDALRRGEVRREPGPPRPINLVHRDDCVGVLHHLLELEDPASLYLGVDSEPVVRDELLDWLAERLGIPPPERGPAEPGVRRGRGSKRCSNARLLASGYRLRRPTFRDGYADLLGTE